MGQASCCCSDAFKSDRDSERIMTLCIPFNSGQRVSNKCAKEGVQTPEISESKLFDVIAVQMIEKMNNRIPWLSIKVLASNCGLFSKNTVITFSPNGLQSISNESIIPQNKTGASWGKSNFEAVIKRKKSQKGPEETKSRILGPGNHSYPIKDEQKKKQNQGERHKKEEKEKKPSPKNMKDASNSLESCMMNSGATYFGVSSDPLHKFEIIGSSSSSEDLANLFFKIAFNPFLKKYTITDYGNGLGTFVMISQPTGLNENELISLGSSVFLMIAIDPVSQELKVEMYENFVEEDPEEEGQIKRESWKMASEKLEGSGNMLQCHFDTLKEETFPGTKRALNGNMAREALRFEAKEGKTVRVGRGHGCEAKTKQIKAISGCHCRFVFMGNGWFIDDGPELGKPSTNGTWRCIFEETVISEGMIFKAQGVLMHCMTVQMNDEK